MSIGPINKQNGDPSSMSSTESETSTESSGGSTRKNVKSPHTVLRHGSSINPDSKMLLSQYEYQTDSYKKLLQETQQSSKDVLITMLQEQLKKIEDIYKINLDQSQDLRYKYCITVQELSGLKKICERYKQETEQLLKEKNESKTKQEIEDLKREIQNWKEQCHELLKCIEVKLNLVLQEVQVGLKAKDPDFKNDMDALKSHYASTEYFLNKQNEKLEYLSAKLQDELKRSEIDQKDLEHKLTGALINLSQLKVEGDKAIKKKDLEKHAKVQPKSEDDESYVFCRNINPPEMEKDNPVAKYKYNKLPGNHSEQELCMISISNPDKIFETRATLNLINCQNPPINSTNQSKNDLPEDSKNTRAQWEKELYDLCNENVRLQQLVTGLQEEDTKKTDNIEQYSLEIVKLKKVIDERNNEIESIKGETSDAPTRKNTIIEELNRQNELLKQDYENILVDYQELKKKFDDKTSERNKSINCLCTSNDKLKSINKELADQHQPLLIENDKELEKAENTICIAKLGCLQQEISSKEQLVTSLTKQNKDLTVQINELRLALKQHQEQVEFKTLENTKLIDKEIQLQNRLLQCKRKSEQAEKDLEEIQQREPKLLQLADEYNMYKTDSESVLIKLNKDNSKLQELLEGKDEEIKYLKDQFNKITKKLEDTNGIYEKNANVRSLEAITDLFKNKEEELAQITQEHTVQHLHLAKLEDENHQLQARLNETQTCRNIASEQLNRKYEREKLRNSQLNEILQKFQKEIGHIKLQLYELLQNLEQKLICLKHNSQEGTYCDACKGSIPKKNVNDMLDSIGKFNHALNSQIAATRFIKYLNEAETRTNFDSHIEVQTENKESASHICPKINCAECQTPKLLIQCDYLLKCLKSVNKKLDALVNAQSSTTSLSLDQNTNTTKGSHSIEKDSENLIFTHNFLSAGIADINKVLEPEKQDVPEETQNTDCCSYQTGSNFCVLSKEVEDLKIKKKVECSKLVKGHSNSNKSNSTFNSGSNNKCKTCLYSCRKVKAQENVSINKTPQESPYCNCNSLKDKRIKECSDNPCSTSCRERTQKDSALSTKSNIPIPVTHVTKKTTNC